MRFYANEQLSPRKSLTPEGFLVCHDVPIARVGVMIYGEGETPIEAGLDGIVRVERNSDEVFRYDTIASFEAKPITLDHPVDFVTPKTWKTLAVGTAQNVRRGTGVDEDLLLADLIITDDDAINEVNSGLREISCGYEADYEQTEPGRGLQRNIIGNHIALVERGRCGSRCAIGDKETAAMPKKKRTWMDRMRTAFKAQDEAALEEAMEEAKADDSDDEEEKKDGESGAQTADTLNRILKRMDAQDKILARLVKDSDEEKEKSDTEDDDDDDDKSETGDDDEDDDKDKTNDRAPTNAQWKDAMSRAEILAPGIRLPTFDSKATPKKMRDALCGCKRRALDSASFGEHREKLNPLLAGRAIDKLPCMTVDTLFVAASEIVKNANNSNGTQSKMTVKDFGSVTTVADINKRNREIWSRK
ncbi:DUF2213 domain-containing protein [Ochrobactrum chromiisoli]|uniref:DUF2213 domain-containing protein n=1 Tax=Ochrobactrum chromiisoli TaxID=2993941 RepID=A0ABT3QUF4_9HYPH|nr:DUF2213 domain-containing protein [Ochrobactrum chromiisoli]MCX2699247.1 DUF2213 domain-containing protein [Ochrobactrum chromiisoli]